MREEFEKNVEYLRRNVPPDDIYIFAEQTFMAALFFLYKWSEWVDVNEESRKDPIIKKWVANIIGLQRCKEKGVDIDLDLDIRSVEEDENSS